MGWTSESTSGVHTVKALVITGGIDPITHKGMGRYSQELIDRLAQYVQLDVLVTDGRPLARLV